MIFDFQWSLKDAKNRDIVYIYAAKNNFAIGVQKPCKGTTFLQEVCDKVPTFMSKESGKC